MMKFSVYKILLFVILFGVFEVRANTISDIDNAPDEQILIAGKKMAEALAKTAPLQIDKTTYLTGGIFYSETKTLFYK